MKKIFLIFTLFSLNAFSQVGINTSSPQAMLDVEGDTRIATTESLTTTPTYVLAIDGNQIVKKVSVTSLGGGANVVKNRIYAIVPKNADQELTTRGTNYDVTFDGEISGINTSSLSVSSDQTSINFPANKAFKVTGMVGIRGRKNGSASQGNPGYITSKFVAGTGSTLIISTQGYSESSTEGYDDGGVTNPIIIFTTGTSGGSIQLLARYGGGDSGTSGYYLAGAPTNTSIGTYFIIEEL